MITAIAAHQEFCSAKPSMDDIQSPGMPSIKLGIVLSELEEHIGGGDHFLNPWATLGEQQFTDAAAFGTPYHLGSCSSGNQS